MIFKFYKDIIKISEYFFFYQIIDIVIEICYGIYQFEKEQRENEFNYFLIMIFNIGIYGGEN